MVTHIDLILNQNLECEHNMYDCSRSTTLQTLHYCFALYDVKLNLLMVKLLAVCYVRKFVKEYRRYNFIVHTYVYIYM